MATTVPTTHLEEDDPVDLDDEDVDTIVIVTVTGVVVGGMVGGLAGAELPGMLQFLALTVYLVIPDKPRLLVSTANRLRWMNLQLDWPLGDGGMDDCNQNSWGSAPYIFIPEATSLKAWYSFNNVIIALLLVNVIITAVQLAAYHAKWPVYNLIAFPRLQVMFLYHATPGIVQGIGFVLAHAIGNGGRVVAALIVFTALVVVIGLMASALYQGLVIEQLWVNKSTLSCTWIQDSSATWVLPHENPDGLAEEPPTSSDRGDRAKSLTVQPDKPHTSDVSAGSQSKIAKILSIAKYREITVNPLLATELAKVDHDDRQDYVQEEELDDANRDNG
eukprot:gene8291-9848_t